MQLSLDSERTFDQILDHINNMIGRIDAAGHLIHMNQPWQQQTGFDETDYGVVIEHWVAPSYVDKFREVLAAASQGKQVNDIYLKLLTNFIGHLPVIGRIVPLFTDDNIFTGVVAIFEPIMRLHPPEHTPFALPARTTDMVVICDSEFRVKSWNRVAEEAYGWTGDQVIGQSFLALVETTFVASTLETVLSHITESGYWSGKTLQANQNGLKMHMMTTFSAFHNTENETHEIVISNHEISHEDVITTQLRLLIKAVETSNSAITIADATEPDLPLVYVNSAFEQITGYAENEILGKNCRFLQGKDTDQEELEILRTALREQKACVVVLRNYRKDGTMFWNELRITPMKDEFGTTTHFVGVATDITDRKIVEQRVIAQNDALIRTNHALGEARVQADEANRLKSEFLATMSHELLTPLHTIIGYTDIQLAGMTGELHDEQRNYLDHVLQRAEHLHALINDILDLSTIEAGQIEIAHKPFSLNELLVNIAQQITQVAHTKALEFEYAIDKLLPDIIVGDAERIKQIALHLLSNAIKFTKSGYVKIEFSRQDSDTWTLTVADSGIGIPENLQETIFDEFRQGDSSWQRQYGGTGLGLAIVRKLVLRMGGKIRVQSKVHTGTTFTVSLPLVVDR